MDTEPMTMPDLACGAEVPASTSTITWDDAGEYYYFCSTDCRRAFVESLPRTSRAAYSA